MIKFGIRQSFDRIEVFHTDVLGIHAVQAPITDGKFRIWGKEIADFAKLLGVKTLLVTDLESFERNARA